MSRCKVGGAESKLHSGPLQVSDSNLRGAVPDGIMICSSGRNTSLDLDTTNMLCTVSALLPFAGATFERIALATKFHLVLVCGEKTLGSQWPTTAFTLAFVMFSVDTRMLRVLRQFLERSSCLPYTSNAQEILLLSRRPLLPGQPHKMTWPCRLAWICPWTVCTPGSIVYSGIAIRMTISMTSSVYPSATSQKKKITCVPRSQPPSTSHSMRTYQSRGAALRCIREEC